MLNSPVHNKKLSVLLVASPKTDLGFGRAMRLPNLGLNSIAANLDHSICDVRVLDLVGAGRNPRAYFRDLLGQSPPDVVGLSSMTFQFAETQELARIVKSVNRKTLVVVGGYHSTVAADLILQDERNHPLIDCLLRNEGEIAFAQLIRAMHRGEDQNAVANLSFVKNGSIVHNPSGGPINLDELRLPDRNSRIIQKGYFLFGYPADVVETSRGCAFNCDFCSIRSMYGNSYRMYAIDRVLQDLRDAKNRGARGIFIADDNITLNGRRYRELCDAITAEKLNLGYFIQASVRGLKTTPGLVEAMAKSGVDVVFLGIENASDETLGFLDKSDQFKSSDVFQVVQELRRHKITVIGGFISGNPDDTEESVRANYAFAKKIGIDIALFFILTPFPGSEARKKLLDLGLVTNPDDFTQYTCFRACIRTNHLSSERLFALREQMGFRYPFEAGSAWKLAMKVPKLFLAKQLVNQIFSDPAEIVGYVRGLLRG